MKNINIYIYIRKTKDKFISLYIFNDASRIPPLGLMHAFSAESAAFQCAHAWPTSKLKLQRVFFCMFYVIFCCLVFFCLFSIRKHTQKQNNTAIINNTQQKKSTNTVCACVLSVQLLVRALFRRALLFFRSHCG